jgi:hypothetical protein
MILKDRSNTVPLPQIKNAFKKLKAKHNNIYIQYSVTNPNDGTTKKISRKVTSQKDLDDFYNGPDTPDYIPGAKGPVKLTAY